MHLKSGLEPTLVETDAENNATVPLRFNSEAGMVANAGVLTPLEGAGHAGIQTRFSRNGGGCGDHVCSHRNR
jgi:hypothetical protein